MAPITSADEAIPEDGTPPTSEDGWSDEEIETMLGTAILVGCYADNILRDSEAALQAQAE